MQVVAMELSRLSALPVHDLLQFLVGYVQRPHCTGTCKYLARLPHRQRADAAAGRTGFHVLLARFCRFFLWEFQAKSRGAERVYEEDERNHPVHRRKTSCPRSDAVDSEPVRGCLFHGHQRGDFEEASSWVQSRRAKTCAWMERRFKTSPGSSSLTGQGTVSWTLWGIAAGAAERWLGLERCDCKKQGLVWIGRILERKAREVVLWES